MVVSERDSDVYFCAFFSVPYGLPIETFFTIFHDEKMELCKKLCGKTKDENTAKYRMKEMIFNISFELTTARWTPSPFRFCASLHCGSESTNSCLKRFTRVYVAYSNCEIFMYIVISVPRDKPSLACDFSLKTWMHD